ncbi:DNA helicase rad5 [Ptychographa xylographoides]|nr:DNA helicase rad5 [Ptychographa xylographoides]
MSYPDVEQRPAKKRRFFVDDPPVPVDHTLLETPKTSLCLNPGDAHLDRSPVSSIQGEVSLLHESAKNASTQVNDGFDKELLENFVGKKLSDETIQRLREIAGDDTERAINMYLDGSWQSMQEVAKTLDIQPRSPSISTQQVSQKANVPDSLNAVRKEQASEPSLTSGTKPPVLLQRMDKYRYAGAFGVGAWATRSGISASLVSHGELVHIERTKSKPKNKIGRGGKLVQVARMNNSRQPADVIVRFTNTKGEEVGRLPKETATWVSSLIDQKVCHFEGICVFAPERIRINDTIYLQLRCFMLRSTFEAGGFIKPKDNNRTTGIFEEKETSEEMALRMRQIALVKLFDEINLHPSTLNETTAKHKRQGLLQAAEVAEQYGKGEDEKKTKPSVDGISTPPTDEEAEDGKELEQDQLDTLYKKAQSFDFNTPTKEPANTFVMDLRKYQKQALYWMMQKEKDEKADQQEQSMHPLWEEYLWPVKDVDDKDLPKVTGQESFYVNPYSGELSLDFPVQEQHCLGGILADGKLHDFMYELG